MEVEGMQEDEIMQDVQQQESWKEEAGGDRGGLRQLMAVGLSQKLWPAEVDSSICVKQCLVLP